MPQATLISGKEVSDEIRSRLKETVARLSIVPQLAIVQVGAREDSNVYIRMKKNFAESVGAKSVHVQLPNTITQTEVCYFVDDTLKGSIICLFLIVGETCSEAKRRRERAWHYRAASF